MVPVLAHTHSQVPVERGERARPTLQAPPVLAFPSPSQGRGCLFSLLLVIREGEKG